MNNDQPPDNRQPTVEPKFWRKALEKVKRREQEFAKLRKPGEPPIVDIVDQEDMEPEEEHPTGGEP